ncbi:MAG TPA: hypothetical protein ENN30_01110 [Candidatus Woesearchaeota archaeon]|nr:hypothetical protein [Candidatus Woesearchaeota archaeon]
MVDMHKDFNIGPYTFTLMEIRDLAISALVLGFVFSIALRGFEFSDTGSAVFNYFIALIIISPALIFHELAHKFVAQKYGCRANYVLWPTGVLLAVFITVITGLAGTPVIFAALGAVMISTSYPTRLGYKFVTLTSSEIGKISASGPITNLVMAVGSYMLMPLHPTIFGISAMINAIIALFNMIPFPPLDGSKIFGWSRIVWLGLLSTAGVLLWLPGIVGILWSLVIAVVIIVAIFLLINYFAPYKPPKAINL